MVLAPIRLLVLRLRGSMLAAGYVLYINWLRLRRRLGLGLPAVPPLPAGTALPIRCLGGTEQARRGGFYLDEIERAHFERDGVLGPFKLFSPEEAETLLDTLRREITPDDVLYGADLKRYIGQSRFRSFMARTGLQGLHGFYQHLRVPQLGDILSRPEITHRLASILGDDLICWRSQFFEKGPGAQGTHWHQASTFREGGSTEKLKPTADKGSALVQLSVWLALTDSTVENGCMRFMSGSQKDSYFADRENQLLDPDNGHYLTQLASYLTTLDFAGQVDAARTAMALSPFTKAKWILEHAIERERPDFLTKYPAVDLEMKAGEFVVFSSLVVHGSHPNTSAEDTRVAFVGRFTTNDVKVYDGLKYDTLPAISGKQFRVSLEDVGCVQVHGNDSTGFNRILESASAG